MTYNAGTDTVSHISALVCAARPDWDEWLVRAVLMSHAMQVDGNDLAIAALRAARNPDLPGPKAIGWRGPHWDGLTTKPPTIADPARCASCGKTEPFCYSRRVGDDDHVFETVERRDARVQRERATRQAWRDRIGQ
jgi:hypothetical protein